MRQAKGQQRRLTKASHDESRRAEARTHQARSEGHEVAEAAARRACGRSGEGGEALCTVRHRERHILLARQAAQRAAGVAALLG